MFEEVDALVVGAGQAGLAASYWLTRAEHPHLVLEQARVGETWRTHRWDSFTLVTPNWTVQLPGFPLDADPDGFLPRDAIWAHLEQYAASFGAPIRTGARVTRLEQATHRQGYLAHTETSTLAASSVIVATGGHHRPNLPSWAADLPSEILQLHATAYRNPQSLPAGSTLVVGSGESGGQIAEELLYESAHPVYMAVGSAGRRPRRYRGRDVAWWLWTMANIRGRRTVDQLPSPRARYAANPHLSGKNGGHEINLRRLRRDGAVLLGRLQGLTAARKLSVAQDLDENLARADASAASFKRDVDAFIDEMAWDVAADPEPEELDSGDAPATPILELDLDEAGITSVIWATGYQPDFSWVRIPVFDEYGYPLQQRGVTAFPGLYFLGLPWLYTGRSGLLAGVGEDAAALVNHIRAVRFRADGGHPCRADL